MEFDFSFATPAAATNANQVQQNRMTKNNTVSPAPTVTPWSLRQQAAADNYQYNQVSPSRSPSGPTYTQLGGAANTRQNNYTSPQQQANPGKIKKLMLQNGTNFNQ